jgi:hypothetical protein
VTLSTGFIDSEGHTFIHDLHRELLVVSAMADSLSIIAALVIGIDGDVTVKR